MLKIHNSGVILEPTFNFEKKGVFNPACVSFGDEVWMYYRAVSAMDISTIGLCKFKNNKLIERSPEPFMLPEYDYESRGMEDPRITLVDGIYYMFYTAYDGVDAQVAYATSKKLPHFEKQGLLFTKITYEEAALLWEDSKLSTRYESFEKRYQRSKGEKVLLWEKDAFLFPEKINGKFALCHRILPGIQVLYFDKFSDITPDFWKHYLKNLDDHLLIEPKYWYDGWNVGGGCPPIKTKFGWLFIYHAVEPSSNGLIYHASAALLDLNNPQKLIGRLRNPLFSPDFSYEKKGTVNNVVFPTSVILENDLLNIYHGASDRYIALKSIYKDELVETLLSDDNKPELSVIQSSKTTS